MEEKKLKLGEKKMKKCKNKNCKNRESFSKEGYCDKCFKDLKKTKQLSLDEPLSWSSVKIENICPICQIKLKSLKIQEKDSELSQKYICKKCKYEREVILSI